LLDEGLRDVRRRRRDDDRVVRGVPGHAEGAVTNHHPDVAEPDRLEVCPCLLGEVGEALHRDHVAGEHRQDRGLESQPGADFQHPFAAGEAQRLHHPGDQAGLGGDLPVGDADRLVHVGQMRGRGRHEPHARDGAERGDDPAVPDTLGAQRHDQILGRPGLPGGTRS
jgi:hypothetical protein